MSMGAPIQRQTSSVRPAGKEELRAAVLKTYLLRVRAERGERDARALLMGVGIDPASVDNETGWVSVQATRRALRAIAELLGADALRDRGEWVTHPEALGTLVRMLRVAERPVDAYRYLTAYARETTRVGLWELDELGAAKGKEASSVRMTYRLRDDWTDDDPSGDDESLLCAARQGELASIPRIWGLPPAEIQHDYCLARGKDACVYTVRWKATDARGAAPLGALAAAIVSGSLVAVAGNWVAGVVSGALGAALGGGAGYLWDRAREERSARVFERNRIAALERGLELRGEREANPGELTGTLLGGKYRIGRKIGSGGIGVVYAAEHAALGHEVAIKVLRGAAARDGSEIARLRREAYIQVHVEHPNVVRVMDLDQMSDGSIYVVMERLHGVSLADRLGKERRVSVSDAVHIFVGVCRALQVAHEKGVVHRDLKPGNIFLCEDGNAKVLDFGMSKLTSAESLTQAGYTLGTPEYMAPEQCIGAQVEAATDLYALGVVMYESITGHLPISSQNRRELLDLHQRQIPKSIGERFPELGVPPAIDAAVMQCLKKRVEERPASAGDLAAALERASSEIVPVAQKEAGDQNWEDDASTRIQPVQTPDPAPAAPAGSSRARRN